METVNTYKELRITPELSNILKRLYFIAGIPMNSRVNLDSLSYCNMYAISYGRIVDIYHRMTVGCSGITDLDTMREWIGEAFALLYTKTIPVHKTLIRDALVGCKKGLCNFFNSYNDGRLAATYQLIIKEIDLHLSATE